VEHSVVGLEKLSVDFILAKDGVRLLQKPFNVGRRNDYLRASSNIWKNEWEISLGVLYSV
jgi:hypothetical protein